MLGLCKLKYQKSKNGLKTPKLQTHPSNPVVQHRDQIPSLVTTGCRATLGTTAQRGSHCTLQPGKRPKLKTPNPVFFWMLSLSYPFKVRASLDEPSLGDPVCQKDGQTPDGLNLQHSRTCFAFFVDWEPWQQTGTCILRVEC